MYALEIEQLRKTYAGGFEALKGISLQVKKGDRVLFGSYAGEPFKVGDRELLLMREDDILAVIE